MTGTREDERERRREARKARREKKRALEELDHARKFQLQIAHAQASVGAQTIGANLAPFAAVGIGQAIVLDTPKKVAAMLTLPFAPLSAIPFLSFALKGLQDAYANAYKDMFGLGTINDQFSPGQRAFLGASTTLLLIVADHAVQAIVKTYVDIQKEKLGSGVIGIPGIGP